MARKKTHDCAQSLQLSLTIIIKTIDNLELNESLEGLWQQQNSQHDESTIKEKTKFHVTFATVWQVSSTEFSFSPDNIAISLPCWQSAKVNVTATF